MANYTNNYGSTFPTNVLTQRTFKDLDNTCAATVNSFKALIAQGKYAEAQTYLASYPDLLNNRFVNAMVINWLFEEIRNAQVYSLKAQQFLYETNLSTDTEPSGASIGDIWLGV